MIPLIVVNLFIKKDEIKFNYISNKFVRVYREKSKIVDKIPLEEYVYGVVASEMPASFEIEALKAQAIASRTYALYQIERNKSNDYDVFDSINSQVYSSEDKLQEKWQDKYKEYSNKIRQIIIDTKGQYLTYNGEIIESFFFSTSTGYTENSEDVFQQQLPYLRSVESKWDESSPSYNDKKIIDKSSFFSQLGLEVNSSINITDVEKTAGGRIKSIKINGTSFKGTVVRNKLNLRSTMFYIEDKNDEVVITTVGFGHGVGMSQYGANGMAKEGYKFDEILKHYYSGVEISKKNV